MRAEIKILEFNPRQIRKTASERMGNRPYARIFAHQVLTELRFRVNRRMTFRSHENSMARLAYGEMHITEFEGINARQAWSNWRTVPKSLSGYLPDRPLFAVDLCCGTGQSTEVLAWYLPAGSEILGLEFNPQFVEKARFKTYRAPDGQPCSAQFRAQSVLDTFRRPDGEPVASGSVDLVNSCGAVGFHFDGPALAELANEIWRVLKPGGLAAIDSGLPGVRRKRVLEAFRARGFRARRFSKSCAFDPYIQTLFVK